ncbi:MAG: cation:proton antiporter [Prochloraceae cyanobacterium]
MTIWSLGFSAQWMALLATAAPGEGYAKALAAAVSFTFIAIFLASRICGEIAVRIGLPSVLGDLTAGVLLGVSALHILVLPEGNVGNVAPMVVNLVRAIASTTTEIATAVYQGPVRIIFEGYAETGVLFLLFTIGLESDLKELLKVGSQAAIVAVAGVTLPFIFGFLGLISLFDMATIPALFAGAALTATSIGITAKVMQDIGVLKSEEGRIILAAAILDDLLGILILAVVASVAEQGEVQVANVVYLSVSATVFVLSAIVLNRFFGPWYVANLNKLRNSSNIFIGALIFGATMGLLADAAGLEPILGSFAAGLVMGGTDKREELKEMFKPLVAIFTTVFFVVIGAKTDLNLINPAIPRNREGLIIASFLILVAILGKASAGFFVVTEDGLNRLAIGTGMVPRGEVGLIFAGLGATIEGLPESLDVAIVLMVLVTTFLSPLLLRLAFATPETAEL